MVRLFPALLAPLAVLGLVSAAIPQARPPAQKTGPLTIYGKGSTGPADDLSVDLPNGSTIQLKALANPRTSPLISKFRTVTATYDDFASVAGDGLAWTASADVCPAVNAATQWLKDQGGGTLMLPPGVANCKTTLKASNYTHIRIEGQGVGAFEQSGTEFKWTGAAGAIMQDMRPATPMEPVSGVRFSGYVLNGNGLAKTGLLTRGLKDSTFHMLIRDTTYAGWDIDIDEAKGPLALGQVTGQKWSSYTTGTGGTPGTYTNVPFYNANGTEGTGATADVTVGSDGSISNIVVKSGGDKYVLGDVLGILPQNMGGVTGFFFTVGNSGNAATSFTDTSQLVVNMKVTQLHPNSVNAKGIRIGIGSAWLDTNSSVFQNVLTLTQAGTGLDIGNADTIEFPFVRAGQQSVNGGPVGIGMELGCGQWDFPSSARTLRFGTVSTTHGTHACGPTAFQPSTRNIIEKYNLESGEVAPTIDAFADLNVNNDQGNPIGNQGFTVNQVRSTYTPTVNRMTTAATVANGTADYRRYGREIFDLRAVLNVQNGTGPVRMSLPCNPYRDTVFFGFDRANSQTMVQGRVGAQDPTVYIYMMDGTAPPSASFQPVLRGSFECSQF